LLGALPGLRAAGDATSEAEALFSLALASQGLGDLHAAREQVEAALEIYEATRGQLTSEELRRSYLASKHRAFEAAVDILMALAARPPEEGYERAAFEASERARARGLLDLLAEAGLDLSEGVDKHLLDSERNAQAALRAAAEQQLRLLAAEHTREQAAHAQAEV